MANTSIIQWNCRGIKPNLNKVKILADQHKAALLCLQETFLNDTDYSIRGSSCYNRICHDVGGRACGGVSVLVQDGTTHSHITLNTANEVTIPYHTIPYHTNAPHYTTRTTPYHT